MEERRRRGGQLEYNEYAEEEFMKCWDSIYGKTKYSWEKNPWVWVIEFKRT